MEARLLNLPHDATMVVSGAYPEQITSLLGQLKSILSTLADKGGAVEGVVEIPSGFLRHDNIDYSTMKTSPVETVLVSVQYCGIDEEPVTTIQLRSMSGKVHETKFYSKYTADILKGINRAYVRSRKRDRQVDYDPESLQRDKEQFDKAFKLLGVKKKHRAAVLSYIHSLK